MENDARTKELPQADKVEIQLAELKVLVVAGFRDQGANLSTVASAVDVLRERVNLHDKRFEEAESRMSHNSVRVKQSSEVDLSQQAQLADVQVWRANVESKFDDVNEKIDAKTDEQTKALMDRLDKVLENPMVRQIGVASGKFVLQVLAFAAAYLALRGH